MKRRLPLLGEVSLSLLYYNKNTLSTRILPTMHFAALHHKPHKVCVSVVMNHPRKMK